MPYQVSMMGWVGLGFEKVTHDQLCTVHAALSCGLKYDTISYEWATSSLSENKSTTRN